MIKALMLVDRMTIGGETSQALTEKNWKFEWSKDRATVLATRMGRSDDDAEVYEIPRERIAWVRTK